MQALLEIDLRKIGNKVKTAFTWSRIELLTVFHSLFVSFCHSFVHIFASSSFHLHHYLSFVCRHVSFLLLGFLFHVYFILFFSHCLFIFVSFFISS